jgi:hypothetical protein
MELEQFQWGGMFSCSLQEDARLFSAEVKIFLVCQNRAVTKPTNQRHFFKDPNRT